MKATDTFRHPDFKHNCAQAIAYKWHTYYPQGISIVKEYEPLRGGTALGGLCGALYAAMQAAPRYASQIEAEFIDTVGARCCHQIKTMTKTPCPMCVDTADRLLEKYLTSRG